MEREKTENGNANDSATELSFDDFKKAMGPEAAKYSDEEIELMRRICDAIADAVFNRWLVAINTHNDL